MPHNGLIIVNKINRKIDFILCFHRMKRKEGPKIKKGCRVRYVFYKTKHLKITK